MLTKKTSSPVRALKFGLTAPVAILFALMFRQAPAIAQVVQQVNTEQSKKTEAVPGASVQTPAKKETAASKSADAEPSFPGGTNDLMKYLAEHLRYPEAAQKDKAEGMVVLQFMVQKDGSLKDITVLQTAHKNHPALEEEALRVVKSMPKWKPAVKNGKIAKMQYTLPIRFKLDQDDPAENAYDVEKMPVYPGGEIEMMRFLASNVKYPESARKDGITGMVAIQFIVEKDGSLTNFETLRTPSPDCAAEAIRVLKLMPKFEPGIKGGSPVRVKYTLPIRFEF